LGKKSNKIDDSRWKNIAWNGVRFPVPLDWEVGQLGTRHLILESEAGPVMEVKWAPVRGHFSHKAHLKKLASRQMSKPDEPLKASTLPDWWQKALAGFEISGFSWGASVEDGMGAILFCPVCRKATLIQFTRTTAQKQTDIVHRILKKFSDHSEDGWISWSVFDIQVRVPEIFQLTRYRLEAGQYKIEFAAGRQKLFLYRWSLASVLIQSGTLSDFARRMLKLDNDAITVLEHNGYQGIEWHRLPQSFLHYWQQRLLGKSPYQWNCLWHLEDKNRILAVAAEGNRPIDTHLINDICASYETV